MLADDLAVLAATAEGLRQFMAAFEAACQRWGLTISTEKTELMLVGDGAAARCEACSSQAAEATMLLCEGCGLGWHAGCLSPPLVALPRPEDDWFCAGCTAAGSAHGSVWQPAVRVGGQRLTWVPKFKYLGCMFSETGDLDLDLARRIQLAAVAFRRLERPFFRQQCIPLHTRMLVFTAMVISVLLYGAEAWALSAQQLHCLEVFHRQRLRMILGVRRTDRIPNEDLYSRCQCDPVEVLIARRQFRWLGHLGRMGEHRIARQLLYSTMAAPGRTRKRGRPPPNLCRTLSGLIRQRICRSRLREMGFSVGTTWWQLSQDRSAWKLFSP